MASKIQSLMNLAVQRASSLVSKTVYYGKVGAELSKTVYFKEGLQPPNFSDFEMVYWRLYKQFLQASTKPKESIAAIKGLGKQEWIKYGSYGVQFLGLYSIGEVIGRRHIVGYKNYSTC
ncbi:HHL179Cp [Eremothecium sinecaudum]|uniref:HHL179Cp n=1 Tax=Eremothecium sinecaudum TaxID=45286 RepID=A0A109V0D0_9SACH|nr:HHL179Cp [Eremothecium sinecaudum]AMD22591.1 HHL179Cp [Eremothecium sinecaudum]